MWQDAQTQDPEDVAAGVLAELERAAQADHETRLQVLEELYRSLEAEIESSSADSLN
ncbi:MAG: hypothetical protein ACLGIB_05535 [Actinomycetota bacterium]